MRQLARNLWVVEHPLKAFGVEFGARMTVVKLANGELLLISPVGIDDKTKASLDALGKVAHLVAPNNMHHLFLKQFTAWYPQAAVYMVPLLAKKRPDIKPTALLTTASRPPWSDEIDHFVLRGGRLYEEALICHRDSRTLVLTDLAFNFRQAKSLWTRIVLSAYGVFGRFKPSIVSKLLIRDRSHARSAIETCMGWDFSRIVVAHGDVIENASADDLRRAFAWLLKH